MTKPKKRSTAKNKRAAMIDLALEQAKAALQNENTRKMLLERGREANAQLQQWLNNRKPDSATDSGPTWLGEKFGQGKLERRVEHLAATIGILSVGRPELIEALGPVREVVAQIEISIEIAGRLPIVKRKQAHFRLDKEIDQLEKMLFEASLPSAISDG